MSRSTYRIRRQLRHRDLARLDTIFLARMGDGGGTVVVPGQPLYRYVRPIDDSQIMVVRRGAAADIEGLKVWVGPDPYYKNRLKILGTYVGDSDSIGGVEPHTDTHYETGSDPANITDRQITPLLVYPTTGMTVRVNWGYMVYQGQPIRISTTDLSLTSSIPGSGARYSLVRVSSTGAVSVQDGVAVASLADLGMDDIPDCAADYAPLAFVRLYYGQTALSKVTSNPDVRMLVWGGGLFDAAASGNATSLQGIPIAGEVPDAGDVLFYDGVNWNPGTVVVHEHIFQEDLSSYCNNNATNFSTANVFQTDTTHVFLNGLLLAPANNYDNGDYSEDVDLQGITLETAPLSSDSLWISYITGFGAGAS